MINRTLIGMKPMMPSLFDAFVVCNGFTGEDNFNSSIYEVTPGVIKLKVNVDKDNNLIPMPESFQLKELDVFFQVEVKFFAEDQSELVRFIYDNCRVEYIDVNDMLLASYGHNRSVDMAVHFSYGSIFCIYKNKRIDISV